MKAASPQKDASPSTVATSKKMQQLERHIQRLTFPCILYFVALYSVVCAANLIYYKSQVLQGAAFPLLTASSSSTSHLQNFLLTGFLGSIFLIAEHNVNKLPLPSPEMSVHMVSMSPVGRAVFLTRHSTYLQCIHFCLSAAVSLLGLLLEEGKNVEERISSLPVGLGGWVDGGRVQVSLATAHTITSAATALMALFCATLGTIVTLFWFGLVLPSPAFYERAEYAKKVTGLNLFAIAGFHHATGLPAGLIDLLLCKRDSLERFIYSGAGKSSSMSGGFLSSAFLLYHSLVLFFFVVYYLSLVVWVFRRTKAMPYQFMEVLYEKGWLAWGGFMLTLTLITFVMMLVLSKLTDFWHT
eukprot:CAMPEP_0178991384 /NCGR_PEP_ID=MMETSP0795-20121207/5495_1 /TAXON_ID=88552 /ORGANISM="Amoebophrya sp., Strain Ameob2" /LENGTH=354 /DNA_ID=CAMNT_0020683081 /DNA_START=154 /DNA_END=1221 /DNA_ORIENTATION=+